MARPLLVSLLLLLCSPLIAPGPARSAASGTEQRLHDWLAALGGPDAVRRVRCTWLWSRFQSGRSGGRSEEWNTSDGRFLSIADFNQFRRVTGWDGARGFVQDENGKVRELGGPAAEAMRTEAYLASNAAFFPERARGLAEAAPDARIGGRMLPALDITAVGGRTVRLYFDPDTGLPARVRRIQDADTVWTVFSGWREVDGVKEPFRVTSFTGPGGDTTEFVVEALRHLEAAPPDSFFLPPPDTLRDFAFPPGASVAVLPMELWDNHPVVRARSHGDDSLPFLLDTGAEASNVDLTLARRWHVLADLPIELKGTGGTQWGGLVRLDTLALAGVDLLGQRIAAVDLSQVRPDGRRLAGVLGYDFFSRFVVQLDFEKRRVTLWDPSRAPAPEGDIIPLRMDGFVPRIEVTLNDTLTATFQLDTGAFAPLVLFRGFWEGHGLLPPGGDSAEATTSGVGGVSRNFEGRLASMRVGPFRIEGPRTLFHADEAGATRSREDAGLAGMGAWRRFTMTLDYARGRLCLKENRGPAEAEDPDSSSLGLERVRR